MLRFCIHFIKFANFFRRFQTAGNSTPSPSDTGKLAGSAKKIMWFAPEERFLDLKQTNKQTKNVIIYISYVMYIYIHILYIYIYIYILRYIYIYIYITQLIINTVVSSRISPGCTLVELQPVKRFGWLVFTLPGFLLGKIFEQIPVLLVSFLILPTHSFDNFLVTSFITFST